MAPMQLGLLFALFGAVLFGIFVYVLLTLQPRWFPQPSAGGPGAKSMPSNIRELRRFVGYAELVLAALGVLFMVTGSIMVGMLFGTG